MTSVSGGWFVGPSSCSLRRSRLVTSGLRALLSHCAQPPAGSSNELEASPPPTPTEADEELGMTDGVTVKLYRYQPEQPQVHVRACPPATPACTHACLPACVPGCLPSDAACGLLPRPLPHPQTLGFSHLLSPEQLSFLMSEARVRASSCLRARDRREQRGRHSSSTRSSPCNEPPTTTRPPPVRSRAGGGPGAGGGGPGGAGDCVEQRGVPAALRSHAALAAGHRPVRQPAAAGGWFEGLPKGGEQSRCVCILPAVDTPTTHPPTHPPTLLTGLPRAPLLRGLRAEPSRDLGGSEVGGCAGARAAAGGNHFLSSFLCTDYYKLYITRASTCAGGLRCETLPGPLPRGPPPPPPLTHTAAARAPPSPVQPAARLPDLPGPVRGVPRGRGGHRSGELALLPARLHAWTLRLPPHATPNPEPAALQARLGKPARLAWRRLGKACSCTALQNVCSHNCCCCGGGGGARPTGLSLRARRP